MTRVVYEFSLYDVDRERLSIFFSEPSALSLKVRKRRDCGSLSFLPASPLARARILKCLKKKRMRLLAIES